MTEHTAPGIEFDADGLAPVVVQDAATGDVLMLAAMNAEALRLTRQTGRAHYWSRGRRRLWRKGETSGHEQIVDEIRVNCERNSLLLLVRQLGAVCHDGYATCYYRRLEPDDALTMVRERIFDPAAVYGVAGDASSPVATEPSDPLALATRRQFGAYAYLRDSPLEAESATSRTLRGEDEPLTNRIADELGELAGVLDGQHRHLTFTSDLQLEASQVIYWLLLLSVRCHLSWMQVRPDCALATTDETITPGTVALLVRAEAGRWAETKPDDRNLPARIHATLALVGQACLAGGLDPLAAVEADLAELASRPYLAAYFDSPAVRDDATG
jgi:phosphoribosyl-AMP cyclohydrolase